MSRPHTPTARARPQSRGPRASAIPRPSSMYFDSPRLSRPKTPDMGRESPRRRPQSVVGMYPVVAGQSPGLAGSPASPGTFSPGVGSANNNNGSGNVKVVVRVRPFLEREQGGRNLIEMNPHTQSTTIHHPSPGASKNDKRNVAPREFYFDRSFNSLDPNSDHFASQESVYDNIGSEFLDHNMEGYHTCIFAYGQTGSGKSYTMMGNDSNPGLIPRTCMNLFSRIDALMAENVSCTVRISYFEVYNEQVRDLLAGSNKNNTKLRVRESPTEGPYVEDLSEFTVKNYNQVLKYMTQGNKARATASTKMNDASSRSHAVFTLVVKQVHFDPDSDATEEKVSRIRLVDLAGSERATTSGATGARLREGSNINKSLTTLGRVIASLAASSAMAKSSSPSVIPYRDSVLTWLLKDSLGGNSKTAMVACISPTDYEETLSTLRYADQAKRIRTRAVINQDIVSGADRDKLVQEMQDQINSLQTSLMQYSQQSQQKEEDSSQFKQELEKVRKAIRFYEERAITEENKRRAIQTESAAIARHNKLLTEHLREITNRTTATPPTTTAKATDSITPMPTTATYDEFKHELDSITASVGCLRDDLRQSRSKFQELASRWGVSAA
uniref:Kinesin-like protein n=1 Tax=Blastobotrys adeninivorans TaxID=409370 RepID=A0A060SWN0_BLAAD